MKTVIRSTAALTIAHGLGYAISLAEVPILARGLGPAAYGELVWVQATALLASLLVDYGFNLSASREIARNRDVCSFVQRICGDVFLAKLALLVLVTLPLAAAYFVFTPVSIDMALAGFVYFLGFGLTPFWYFQGMERMGRAVTVEVIMRLTALLMLLFFVSSPEDKTLALSIMAVGSVICTGTTIAICRVEVGQFSYSISGAISQLRQSTSFFVYKSSSQIMTTAATTVLGSIAGKTTVGIFAPTEKVIKAVIGLALPVFQAFYPHLSRLFSENSSQKKTTSMWLIIGMTSSGLAAATILLFVGPAVMTWMLGPGYGEVNQLLQLMVWLIPLRLLNQTLGFVVLLPAHKEHVASMAMLFSSVLSLSLGGFLTMSYGAIGMVIGMLVGEVLLATTQVYLSALELKRKSG